MSNAKNRGTECLKIPGSFPSHAESSRAPPDHFRPCPIADPSNQPNGLKKAFQTFRSFWQKKTSQDELQKQKEQNDFWELLVERNPTRKTSCDLPSPWRMIALGKVPRKPSHKPRRAILFEGLPPIPLRKMTSAEEQEERELEEEENDMDYVHVFDENKARLKITPTSKESKAMQEFFTEEQMLAEGLEDLALEEDMRRNNFHVASPTSAHIAPSIMSFCSALEKKKGEKGY